MIRGCSFVLQGGTVYNDTYGNTAARSTDIAVNGDVVIDNASVTGNAMAGSASGAAIKISGGNLLIKDALINTDAQSGANGSDVALRGSGNVTVTGTSIISTDANGGGRAGNLVMEATNISIENGATVSSSAPIVGGPGGTGAGAIAITAAQNLAVSGIVRSDTGDGTSGSITLKAKDLSMSGTGLITTTLLTNSTIRPRTSGDIVIKADKVTLSGDSRIESRAFYSSGSGSSGSISIDAATVALTERSAISASIDSASGSGGNINIKASDNVLIASRPVNLLNEQGSIASDSTAGDAGHISIEAPRITIANGATVSTIARGGSGEGGNITLTASDEVVVEGVASPAGYTQSSIETDTLKGGTAGNISIVAPRITIGPGALISSAAVAGSTGAAGNIQIEQENLLWVDGSSITTQSAAANGGNIAIEAPGLMVVTQRRDNGNSHGRIGERRECHGGCRHLHSQRQQADCPG